MGCQTGNRSPFNIGYFDIPTVEQFNGVFVCWGKGIFVRLGNVLDTSPKGLLSKGLTSSGTLIYVSIFSGTYVLWDFCFVCRTYALWESCTKLVPGNTCNSNHSNTILATHMHNTNEEDKINMVEMMTSVFSLKRSFIERRNGGDSFFLLRFQKLPFSSIGFVRSSITDFLQLLQV